MTNLEMVEQRVTRLEERMDAQTGVRADRSLLEALRTTQVEHSQTLNSINGDIGLIFTQLNLHRDTLDAHTAMLDRLDHEVQAVRREHGAKLDEHGAKLDEHGVQLGAINAKLDRLLDARK